MAYSNKSKGLRTIFICHLPYRRQQCTQAAMTNLFFILPANVTQLYYGDKLLFLPSLLAAETHSTSTINVNSNT